MTKIAIFNISVINNELWKENITSYCNKYHQYYKINNHLLNELAEQKKITTIYDIINPGPGLGQTQACLSKLSMSHDYSGTY